VLEGGNVAGEGVGGVLVEEELDDEEYEEMELDELEEELEEELELDSGVTSVGEEEVGGEEGDVEEDEDVRGGTFTGVVEEDGPTLEVGSRPSNPDAVGKNLGLIHSNARLWRCILFPEFIASKKKECREE
jgi:hypothetical protein